PGRARGAVGPERLAARLVAHGDRLITAVGNEHEPSPLHAKRALAEHAVASRAALERHDGRLAQREEMLVVRHADVVRLRPVEHRCLERALGKRIGDLAGEALEARELAAPSLAHRFAELAVEVTEKQKRLPAAPFLAN